MLNRLFIIATLIASTSGKAVELECKVVKKISSDRDYTAADIAKEQPSVRVQETAAGTTVSRCGLAPSVGKVTCDEYKIDHIETSVRSNITTLKEEKIKKFYLYRAQFDVQIFPDFSFIENNGRGTISFGVCSLAAP